MAGGEGSLGSSRWEMGESEIAPTVQEGNPLPVLFRLPLDAVFQVDFGLEEVIPLSGGDRRGEGPAWELLWVKDSMFRGESGGTRLLSGGGWRVVLVPRERHEALLVPFTRGIGGAWPLIGGGLRLWGWLASRGCRGELGEGGGGRAADAVPA